MLVTSLLAAAIVSTGVWQGDSVDVVSFDVLNAPTTFTVLAWGDVDGQYLLPVLEMVNAQDEVVVAEGGPGVCAFGWGGCSFGTASVDPGRYTFYGYLDGFAETTHNTYRWEIQAMNEASSIQRVAPVSLPHSAPAQVPEPATYVLTLAGLLALMLVTGGNRSLGARL